MLNHTNTGTGITREMILELCQSHELVRYAIPEGFELLLPRFRQETQRVMDGTESREIHRWVVECWWRSAQKGTLGYFVKIDLLSKSVQEFRELSGDVTVSGITISDAEMAYLDQGPAAWQAGNESPETAGELDDLWDSLAPDELREYVSRKKEDHTITSYMLPVESLTYWNWEKLRDMLLKRENTTIERILDYLEYKKSGSDKLYIAPEQRAEAKARGMKFWRDEDDL